VSFHKSCFVFAFGGDNASHDRLDRCVGCSLFIKKSFFAFMLCIYNGSAEAF